MLVPVLVRANRKISTSLELTLESIIGSNLPLLFAEIEVINRTSTASSVTIEGERSNSYVDQADPDFNGLVTTSMFVSQSIGMNQSMRFTIGSLTPVSYGVSTVFTFAHAGPALESWISIVIRGMIESSVRPDSAVIVNN